MADIDDARDDDELELDVSQGKGNKMTNILLIVLIVVVLLVGGVVTWFLISMDSGKATPTDGNNASSEETSEVKKEALEPLKYLSLTPEFIINFGLNSKVRYLQIDLQVTSRDEAGLKMMSANMPVIRNDVLFLLSSLTYDELKTREGKEILQKKILNKINSIITIANAEAHAKETSENDDSVKENISTEANTGEKNPEFDENEIVDGPIENVYFLSFIMQ